MSISQRLEEDEFELVRAILELTKGTPEKQTQTDKA